MSKSDRCVNVEVPCLAALWKSVGFMWNEMEVFCLSRDIQLSFKLCLIRIQGSTIKQMYYLWVIKSVERDRSLIQAKSVENTQLFIQWRSFANLDCRIQLQIISQYDDKKTNLRLKYWNPAKQSLSRFRHSQLIFSPLSWTLKTRSLFSVNKSFLVAVDVTTRLMDLAEGGESHWK